MAHPPRLAVWSDEAVGHPARSPLIFGQEFAVDRGLRRRPGSRTARCRAQPGESDNCSLLCSVAHRVPPFSIRIYSHGFFGAQCAPSSASTGSCATRVIDRIPACRSTVTWHHCLETEYFASGQERDHSAPKRQQPKSFVWSPARPANRLCLRRRSPIDASSIWSGCWRDRPHGISFKPKRIARRETASRSKGPPHEGRAWRSLLN